MRKLAAIAAVCAFLLGACGPKDAGPKFTEAEQRLIANKTITADELAAADCSPAAECWVAVDGVVYDVSTVSGWSQGQPHHGVTPGTDASEAFRSARHAASQLEGLTVVGGYAG